MAEKDSIGRLLSVTFLVLQMKFNCVAAQFPELSPELFSLTQATPSWALRVAPLNYTVAFLNLIDPSATKACSMQLELFSNECGMCMFDCPLLVSTAMRANRYTSDRTNADLIIVSPEMGRLPKVLKTPHSPYSENNLTKAVFNLPMRPLGKYYVIRKHRAAVNYKCEKTIVSQDTDPTALAAVGANVKCKYFCDVLFRRDIIWANYDLAEHNILDDSLPDKIQGVTLPAGRLKFKGKTNPLEQRFGNTQYISQRDWEAAVAAAKAKMEVESLKLAKRDVHNPSRQLQMPQKKYLAWFRGKCHDGAEDSSHARFLLALMFQA